MANPDKSWVFKVSIHCEGCKRKVHKIIHNIKGVEKVDIDLKQHKVIVHGNVDPQTVIWKLEKSGKHAELWPQKEKLVNKESKRPGKDKITDQQCSSQEEGRDQSVQENNKGEEKSAGKGQVVEGNGSLDGKASGDSEGEMVQKPTVIENRADAAEKVTPGGGPSSTDNDEGKTGHGNGPHKKKNKCQNGKKETSECDDVHTGEKDAAAGYAVPGGPDPNNGRSNQGPSHHHRAQRPEHTAQSHGPNYAPPSQVFPAHNHRHCDYPSPPSPPLPPGHCYGPPVYAVNHHTARPASSYSASQYYSPPINSYHACMPPRPEECYPYYYDPYHHQRPSDSFQLFSDDNPNACSLM